MRSVCEAALGMFRAQQLQPPRFLDRRRQGLASVSLPMQPLLPTAALHACCIARLCACRPASPSAGAQVSMNRPVATFLLVSMASFT